jgi:catechol 2,3-dioxygenase-like lactoylglutathione lyase family enzyme
MNDVAAKDTKFETVTPRVPVTDIDEALKFYTKQLGFDLVWTWGAPTTHAGVSRDAVALDLVAVAAERAGRAMLYIRVNGVDAYHEALRERGVLVGDLGDRDYGLRDFEVVDVAGNRIIFGEPITGRGGAGAIG